MLTKTHLTGVSTVMFSVADQDAAIAFYSDVLGFEKRTDTAFGDGYRWVEVGLPGADTTIALVIPPPDHPIHPGVVGIGTDDVDAAYEALKEKGAKVDDMMRQGPPVPTMFRVEDPDGNSLWIVESQQG
jgi:catechol 2,3-dioxygenase-like lactoylglutathione lyase family enzyme